MSASSAAVVVGAAALGAAALFRVPAAGSRSPLRHPGGRPVRGAAARGPSGARWARPTDLRELLVGGHTPPPGRLALGRSGRRLVAAEVAQSVIVFGPTQSRKTSGFAVPAILEWRGPVLAASVKSDLLAHTVAHRRTLGRVQCFDPTGTTGLPPSPWSPLPVARTWPGARRAAATLTEVGRTSVGTMSDGDFWYATAARMLAPLLFAAAHGRRQMADVLRWVETGEEAEVLDLLERTGVPEALDAARSAFAKEERQRSSIATTVETLLEPFAGGPGRSDWTVAEPGGEAVDPDRLLSGTDTLYLSAPAHDQRRLTPLFVGVLRAVLDRAYDRVARAGRPLDPPLLVVLDEAANIAPLSDLDALAATAAGHGVQLVTVWHDLAQITARFGPKASTVVNNHRAKLFLSGISDPSTLEYASSLVGDEELALPATTSGGRGGPSTTHSPSVRRLARPDALRRVPPGSGVLVYRDLPPARLRLRTWFDDRWLRSLVAEPAVRPERKGRPGARAGRARLPGPGPGGAVPRGAGRSPAGRPASRRPNRPGWTPPADRPGCPGW